MANGQLHNESESGKQDASYQEKYAQAKSIVGPNFEYYYEDFGFTPHPPNIPCSEFALIYDLFFELSSVEFYNIEDDVFDCLTDAALENLAEQDDNNPLNPIVERLESLLDKSLGFPPKSDKFYTIANGTIGELFQFRFENGRLPDGFGDGMSAYNSLSRQALKSEKSQ